MLLQREQAVSVRQLLLEELGQGAADRIVPVGPALGAVAGGRGRCFVQRY